jgi:hypothetical protein
MCWQVWWERQGPQSCARAAHSGEMWAGAAMMACSGRSGGCGEEGVAAAAEAVVVSRDGHVRVGVAGVVSSGQVCPGWQGFRWNTGVGKVGRGARVWAGVDRHRQVILIPIP